MSEAPQVLTSARRASTCASHSRAVERVIRAMRERVDEPFSLQSMAEIAFLSPFHFDRVFRQTTGIPACQFLGALRIEAAKRLLLTTKLSITDICFEVGYNSLGTFTTRFTQLVGLPPRQLRHLAQQTADSDYASLCKYHCKVDNSRAEPVGLRGQIIAETSFSGMIFAGLFTKPIPQSRPLTCALLSNPGPFRFGCVRPGQYSIFVAAFPKSDDPLSLLLPEEAAVRVGLSPSVEMAADQSATSADVELRPMRLTDPPLLIALPFLFIERMGLRRQSALSTN